MNKLVQALTKIRGGIPAPHEKNTAEKESVRIKAPKTVIIPMQQHIGAPCQPTVKPKEIVTIGQVIADSEAFVSAPIHAPVSGKIKSIKPLLLSNGKMCDAIHLENDGLDTYGEAIQPISVDSKDDLIRAARSSGLVGIGGAGFPLHAKLANQDELPLDTLIINGAECEPYITSDYRESMEFPERIIAGMAVVMKHLNISKGLIGIEDNKPKGIENLVKVLKQQEVEVDIDVMELPAKYPQGAEKMLVYAATGRRVPIGKLPAHVGCLILNISTISLFYRYLSTGIPLVEKRITVDGSGIKNPQNIVAPIGTKISDILDFCEGFTEMPSKVILGGPMMGIAQYSTDLPITKQTNAITVLAEKAAALPEESPCIRCGRCIKACPLSLQPVEIERYAKIEDCTMLRRLNVAACMECGSCSYVCPSGRKLVQYMKHAKVLEREAVK